MDIKIVKAEERHLPEMLQMEKENFSVPWSEKSFRFELNGSNVIFLVAEQDEKAVGFCVLHYFCDDGEIFNLAVHKDLRRQNLGNTLLSTAIDMGKEKGVEHFYLEVRESNTAALNLYSKNGFREVGRRKDYYDYPREDGLIYRLDIDEKDDK